MVRNNYLRLTSCVFIASLVLTGCAESGGPDQLPEATVGGSELPEGQLGNAVVPTRYQLELKIDPTQERFSGVVAIDVTVNEARDDIWLHGKHLDVSEVYLIDGDSNRIDASYEERHDSGVALVTLDSVVGVGSATIHFTYDAPFDTTTNGLFTMARGDDHYAASQLEAIAARRIFPGFDEPAFKVPFDLAIVARADDVVITNTPEASSEELADGFVKHVFMATRPLPTYLLAFAVGPYDVVDYGMLPANSIRDREVALRGISARGLGKRMHFALENTEGLLTVLEEYFGTPYPYRKLDIIAVPESFGGAMENPGAITYDEYLMLMDENSPLSQRRSYTFIHSHELAHMWFGDLVTPVWWNDIWLNEAFATWMSYKTADAYWPDGEFERSNLSNALGAMSNDSLASARQIREPVDHNDKIHSAFDGITYSKGGGVLAMLERYVGEDKFQAGVRLHMDRHTDGTATAEDFIASLAEGSERLEIEGAFKSFIEQPGIPLLSVSLDCEDEENPRLNVQQARYAPLGSAIDPEEGEWQIPMCVSYTADGATRSSCALLNKKQQSIDLDAVSCPTQLHPNADGSGYYRFSLDEAGWQELIANALSLPAAEALVLGDSLDAGFRAGVVSADTYVSGMMTLTRHDAWDVADAVTDYFESITVAVDPDQLETVQNAFQKIVQPRFATLENASDSGSILLRQRMQRFLVVIARDPDMRAPLAAQAAAIIGFEQEADAAAAPASQYETIFSVGVQDLGEPYFDLLLERLVASEDPQFRYAASGALARVEDPVLVKKLQKAGLDGMFKQSEFRGIVSRQMVRQATTELTYAWLLEHTDEIINTITGGLATSIIPSLGSSFCTVERANDWQTFVTDNAELMPGYDRSLAQALESVHLCAALREASSVELVAAFEKI